MTEDEIVAANERAVLNLLNAQPILTGVDLAIRVVPKMGKNIFLHSGPDQSWLELTGPMKGAAIGAMIYEGYAENPRQALKRLEEGAISFQSAHNYNCVSPMAGIISQSMPVFGIKNQTEGNHSFSPVNEGVGKIRTLRYGAYASEVIRRLDWIRDVFMPCFADALKSTNGINLKEIISESLRRGDECHNRNKSATAIFFKSVAPKIVRNCINRTTAAEVLEFIGGNDHFFLNLSMAASKATADAAHGIRNSTIVTGMAANGRVFGVRISGLGPKSSPYRWFTTTSPFARGRYFEGYGQQDANPALGDSYVSECVGIGAFAMAASPAITEFVGGTPGWAERQVKKMAKITLRKHKDFVIPYMNYQGTPTGIDLRKVVRTGIRPLLNTGIAHRKPGIGQIGAGIFWAPQKCFAEASDAWLN